MEIGLLRSEFDLPYLGTVSVRPASLGARQWYATQDEQKSWSDAHAFMSDFLGEFCTPVTLDAPTFQARVTVLSPPQLDEIADILMTASAARGEMEPEDRLTGCAAFRASLKHQSEAFQDLEKTMIDRVAAGSGAFALIQRSALSDAERLLQSMNQMTGFQTLLKQIDRERDLMRQFSMPSHLQFATRLAEMNKIMLDPYRDSIRSTLAIAAGGIAGSLLLSSQMTDTGRLIDQIRDTYRFQVVDTVSLSMMNTDYISRLLDQTGFAVTAAAGLERLGSQALAATILTDYERGAPSGDPLFDDTLAELRGLEAAPDPDAIVSFLIQILEFLKSSSARQNTDARHAIIVAYASLAMGIATFALPYFNDVEDPAPILQPAQVEFQIVTAQSQTIVDNSDQDIRYLTGHRNLRSHPDLESDVLVTLNTDQIVIVHALSGDWAHVTVQPYAGEPTLEGWVHRDGLSAR